MNLTKSQPTFQLTWTDAFMFCEHLNMNLVILDSTRKQYEFFGIMSKKSLEEGYFVGATDEGEEHAFYWSNGKIANFGRL